MRTLMPFGGVRRDSVLVGVATQPPREVAAAALSQRLKTELYNSPALIPASPWLSSKKPSPPRVSLETNPATSECMLRIGSVAETGWTTVRARVNGEWWSWVIPAAQGDLVIAPACTAELDTRVTSVNRFGIESDAVAATLRPARRRP
jgi:hypothetical protein